MKLITKAVILCAFVFHRVICETPVISELILQVYKFNNDNGKYSDPIDIENLTIGENTLLLHQNTEIRLTCVGDAYVEIEPPSQIVDNRMTITNKRFFENEVLEYESVFWGVVDSSNTGSYTCKIEGSNATRMYYIYVKGSSAFTVKQPEKDRIVANDGIIPCRVTDPAITVALFLEHQPHSSQIKIPYDPKVGFRLDDKIHAPGVYTCKSERPVEEMKFVVQHFQGVVHYKPKEKVISAEEEEQLIIECFRDGHHGETISYRVSKGATSSSFSSKNGITYKGLNGEKGNITCATQEGTILNTWMYRIATNPRLEFVSWTGSVLCHAESRNIQFYSLKCDNPRNCLWRKFNLNKDAGCHGFVYSGSLCKPDSCSRLFESHQNGLLLCQVDGFGVPIQFFTGLNRIKYLDWTTAPLDALIRIDEVGPVVYNRPGQKTYFYCEAVSFLFMQNLVFGLKYRNESIIKLPEESLEIDPDTIKRTTPSIINYGVSFYVTEEVIEVFCFAPWINATESFHNTSRKITVKDVVQPTLKGESREFTIGDEGRSISCLAEGQPPPKLSWLLENNTGFTNYTTFVIKTDEGINLNFPKITKEFEGFYVCRAQNSEGEERRTFKVKVYERKTLTKWQLAVLAIGMSVIFMVTLFFLLVFLRKYKQAKDNLRDLTDMEVEIFINGKPDMINSEDFANQNAQFMPYNAEYEIPESDLNFDRSKNVLGSGAFGIVYKGNYQTSPVAIKTTKADADVTYFKSLLSELKIIMYIGKHENIVEFLGSCTVNIKQRVLFMVIEYSPFGSLHDFLKMDKSLNPDASNTNNDDKDTQMIKLTDISHYNNCIRITPANMVSWAFQIANGMHHLETKRVIHGDLATRNVLLFVENRVKISDFGLSKQLYEYRNYVKKQRSPLPFRWLALETLKKLTFSTKSDVWSYGVTIWEIYSFGNVPFANREWDDDFVQDLTMGMRLNCPRHCPKMMYEKMKECWNEDPLARPSFEELIEFFKQDVTVIALGY